MFFNKASKVGQYGKLHQQDRDRITSQSCHNHNYKDPQNSIKIEMNAEDCSKSFAYSWAYH